MTLMQAQKESMEMQEQDDVSADPVGSVKKQKYNTSGLAKVHIKIKHTILIA